MTRLTHLRPSPSAPSPPPAHLAPPPLCRAQHFDALCAALAAALTQLFAEDKAQLVNAAAPEQPGVEASEANVLQTGSGALRLRVLDLACGSGEASIAVHRWMLASAPAFGRLALTAADPFTAGAFHARTQLPR